MYSFAFAPCSPSRPFSILKIPDHLIHTHVDSSTTASSRPTSTSTHIGAIRILLPLNNSLSQNTIQKATLPPAIPPIPADKYLNARLNNTYTGSTQPLAPYREALMPFPASRGSFSPSASLARSDAFRLSRQNQGLEVKRRAQGGVVAVGGRKGGGGGRGGRWSSSLSSWCRTRSLLAYFGFVWCFWSNGGRPRNGDLADNVGCPRDCAMNEE